MCKKSQIKNKMLNFMEKKSQKIVKNKFFAVFAYFYLYTTTERFILLILKCHLLCSFSPNFEWFHQVNPKIW